MNSQKYHLRKMQLQALMVNVQSFIDQFSIRKLDQVNAFIDIKDPNLFPKEIKDIVKNEFAQKFHL